MSTESPKYRFNLGPPVSHGLNILLGGAGCLNPMQRDNEAARRLMDDPVAQEVAKRVIELATAEPPVLVIDEDEESIFYSLGDDGAGTIHLRPASVSGPYDTPDRVGVPPDSEHLYPANRID